MENLDRNKKIIYTVAGAVLLLILGYIVYQYIIPAFQARPQSQPSVGGNIPAFPGVEQKNGGLGGTGTATTTLPSGQEQRLFRLTTYPVISPSLNGDESKILFYKKEGGELISIGFTGGIEEKLSNITVVDLMEAVWGPDRQRRAVFYLDGETKKGFLHISTSSTATLPQNIRSFSWSPDGKSLAYLLQRSGGTTDLVVADASGKNPKVIFSTPIRDASIRWITSNKIVFQTAPSGLGEGFIFLFTRADGVFTRIGGPLFGLEAIWSPDGSRFLVSSTDASGRNLVLSLRDTTGKTLFNSDVHTLAEKCVFADTNTLYCAVPRALPQETTLPDDYLRGELNTSDVIQVLDFSSRIINTVVNLGAFDVSNLIVTKKQDFLFFVNRTDGTLWSYKLK